ncbi:hypothetical protein D3C74_408250 [compost metagenome]
MSDNKQRKISAFLQSSLHHNVDILYDLVEITVERTWSFGSGMTAMIESIYVKPALTQLLCHIIIATGMFR